jgi:capsular polysaccharide transport system permease protein
MKPSALSADLKSAPPYETTVPGTGAHAAPQDNSDAPSTLDDLGIATIEEMEAMAKRQRIEAQQRRREVRAQRLEARREELTRVLREPPQRETEDDEEDPKGNEYDPPQRLAAPPVLSRETHRRRKLLSGIISALFLLLPPLAATIYFYGWASDLYGVDTTFTVRLANQMPSPSANSSLGQLSGITGLGRATDESFAVVEFVTSREALKQVGQMVDLRAAYSSPSIDWFNRLAPDANDEQLYAHYKGYIEAYYDEIRNMVVLHFNAYDPQVAYQVTSRLLSLSENLINEFNRRSEEDLLALARQEVTNTQEGLKEAEAGMTKFRMEHNMVDPIASSSVIVGIIGQFQARAAAIQSEITRLLQISRSDSPKLTDLRNQLAAVEKQIETEQSRLTGQGQGTDALAPYIEQYGLLTIQREIAAERYSAALNSLEEAMADARRQKLYVISVEPPRAPEVALFPERARMVMIVMIVTFTCWAILRMILAALRDHLV